MGRKIFFSLSLILLMLNNVWAYWIWTPKTGKWVNPKYAVKDSPQEQLDWAMNLYMGKDYEGAIREFKKLIKYYPHSSQACDAQYFMGRIYEERGKFYEAFQAYQKVIDLYPYTQKVEEVIEREYRIGELYFTGHRDKFLGMSLIPSQERALEIFQKVVENAPYGKYAPPSQYKIGIILRGLGQFEEAKQAFLKLEKNYPESEFAREAKYQIGLSGYKVSPQSDYTQEETESSIKEIEEFLITNPQSPLKEDAEKVLNDLKNRKAESLFKTAQFYERQKKFSSALLYYEEIVNNYPDSLWAAKSLERISILKENK
ncbi:MAG: outer membrane protein assembly factor BamD [Candidatus Omnitrophica bacterium]|nr:outer membrane protein assembly factor BamD [Candidatus Omnitrophota bacterium]MCM8798112.1 outer membrane protein assembly factor BamD [Candidatus Omnitrophota bacterium]